MFGVAAGMAVRRVACVDPHGSKCAAPVLRYTVAV
jgi:hypothetical protein